MTNVGSVGGSPRPEEFGQQPGVQSPTTGEAAAGEARLQGNVFGLRELAEMARQVAADNPDMNVTIEADVPVPMDSTDGDSARTARVTLRYNAKLPMPKYPPTLEGTPFPGER